MDKSVRGFTLIELLIAISLSIAILAACFTLFSSNMKAYNRASNTAKAIQIRQYVLRKISQDIRSSQKAEINGIKLTLTRSNETISYDYTNNKVRRTKSKSTAYLTDPDEIKSLSFGQIRPNLIVINLDSETLEAYCRNAK